MSVFEAAFEDLVGGRVLDVATGEGGFIQILLRYLEGCSKIVGIDTSGSGLKKAQSNTDSQVIQFAQMNAGRQGFEKHSFNNVNISASLHHLANVPEVLLEMKRVLKPGGHFIITEMHRDGMTDAQLNSVRIHHWAARVDTALGSVHDRTFSRQEVLDFVDDLGLNNVVTHDFNDRNSDPMDAEAINSVVGYLDRYIKRAQTISNNEGLIMQGEELVSSLHEKGVQREPVLVVLGEKAEIL
jgi:SAM-dependent methyltransferase